MLAGWPSFEPARKLFGVPRVFPAAMAIVQRSYLPQAWFGLRSLQFVETRPRLTWIPNYALR